MPAYAEVDETFEYLDLKNGSMGINELIDIFTSLSEDRILKQIDLSYNISKDDSNNPEAMANLMQNMLDSLGSNKSLTALDFCGNHLGDFGPHPFNKHEHEYLRELTKALKKSNIKKIDLSDNLLIGESGRVYSGLSDLIKKYVVPNKVHTLKLRDNHLHGSAIGIVTAVLGPYSVLEELDLTNNCCGLDSFGNVNPEAILSFSKLMSQSHSLRRLILSRNFLHDLDLITIAEAIIKMPNLNLLDISYNNFTNIGVEALKDGIIGHCNLKGREGLKILNLNSNPICSDGLDQLSMALLVNDTIVELSIINCGFRSSALINLQQKLEHNTTLLNLSTGQNRITQDAQDLVQAEIEANQLLLVLKKNHTKVDTASLSQKTYLALARKLHSLPEGVLSLLHSNSSFNQPLSVIRETLYLLCPPGRSFLVSEVLSKSDTIIMRLALSGWMGDRLKAHRTIFHAVMKWYRKFQFKKKLRIQANALAAQKANKLHRGGTKNALLKMQSSSQLLPSQRNPMASDALTSSAMRLSPLKENVSFRRDSKK